MICAGNDYRKTESLATIICSRMARKPASVLVVGCGAGIEAAILADTLQANVTGIDLKVDFDPHAQQRADLRRGDATQLEFADKSFDLVYSFHALEHIPNYRRALQEMHRVLKYDGWYCVGTPNRSRLLGYMGIDGLSIREKLRYNALDWAAMLKGQFRNELGAHAGFTEAELAEELKGVFGNAESATLPYYLAVYSRYGKLIRALHSSGVARFCFPSVYFLGKEH